MSVALNRADGAPDGPTLLYLMKQVELAVRARLEELARPLGLTALQYTALTVLDHQPGLTSAHLARRSFVTTQSMADMIGALLDRDLIERHRDEADRRRLVIALTESGRSLLAQLRPQVAALEREMLTGLSAGESAQLRRMMQVCRETLAARPAGSGPSPSSRQELAG